MPQAVSGLLLLIFLAVVFGSTVFTRNPGSAPKYELELFWSWKKVIYEGSQSLLKENLLNMILLFPMGILLPAALWRRLSWWQVFLSGARCLRGNRIVPAFAVQRIIRVGRYGPQRNRLHGGLHDQRNGDPIHSEKA